MTRVSPGREAASWAIPDRTVELAHILSTELDRQERIANTPDIDLKIGGWQVLRMCRRHSTPSEQQQKILRASTSLSEAILDLLNPFKGDTHEND